MMADKRIYSNKPQRLTPPVGANTTVIDAGRRAGKSPNNAYLILTIQSPESPTVATAYTNISPVKNSLKAKKTYSNTTPTASTPSILSTLATKISRSTILSRSQQAESSEIFAKFVVIKS